LSYVGESGATDVFFGLYGDSLKWSFYAFERSADRNGQIKFRSKVYQICQVRANANC